jgi:hypothetical protein|tara:strand:- start:337 stop:927 length:591 start_codon:yes stop_codon:yes gene_type:complete
MCEPLTFISAALGAAQAGYAYRGQQYQQGIALRNKRIAKESEEKRVANEMTATNLRQIQEGIADAQLIQENDRRLVEAESTAVVAAGEAGVSGNVVSAKLGDLEKGGANARFAIETQAKLRGQAYEQRFKNLGLAYRNNIMRYEAAPVPLVNRGQAVLSGLTTGMNMYSVGKEAGLDTALDGLGESLKGIFTIGRG